MAQAQALLAKVRAIGLPAGDAEQKLLKLEARVAIAAGEGAPGLRILEQLLERNPLDGEALLLAGDQYARSGEAEKAEFKYDAAAKLDAFAADAFLKHAQLKVQKQKYTEAVELLRRAQKVKPRDNVARYLERVEQIAARARSSQVPALRPSPPAPMTPSVARRPRRWTRVLRFLALGVLLVLEAMEAWAQEAGGISAGSCGWSSGTALPGVTVTVRGTTLATTSDGQGRFQIPGVPLGDQVVRFSRSGYAAAVVTDVRVVPGQVTTVNGTLRPEFFEMEEYEVTAEVFQEQALNILQERQETSSILEAIGSRAVPTPRGVGRRRHHDQGHRHHRRRRQVRGHPRPRRPVQSHAAQRRRDPHRRPVPPRRAAGRGPPAW